MVRSRKTRCHNQVLILEINRGSSSRRSTDRFDEIASSHISLREGIKTTPNLIQNTVIVPENPWPMRQELTLRAAAVLITAAPSAYPPILSVNSDMLVGRPSARNRHRAQL